MKNWKFIVAVIVCFWEFGLNAQLQQIYQPQKLWIFTAYELLQEDAIVVGYLKLNVPCERKLETGQCEIEWRYDMANSTSFTETTLGFFVKDNIEIHPPREDMFRITQFTPFPEVLGPLEETIGFSSEIESTLVSGWDRLNGQVIKKRLVMSGKETCRAMGEKLTCYTSEGWNTSHQKKLGKYKSKFWLHPTYGFVRMQYWKPDGSSLLMVLEEVQKEGD